MAKDLRIWKGVGNGTKRTGNYVPPGADTIVEVKYDKQFESTCLLIAQKTNMDARKMTVLQFYNAIDNIKAQAEAEAKSFKKHKKR